MGALTDEQVKFLNSQSISLSQVYDASGLSKQERIAQMDRLQVPFYYGGAACQASGHTLRTKAGHCIQCDTSKIAYQLRQSADGFVYLAYAKSKRYLKVGVSKNEPSERLNTLRFEAYGGVSDWEMIKKVRLDYAGKKEFEIHSALEPFRIAASYVKSNGKIQECRELFCCDLKSALKVFDRLIST